MSKKSKRRYHLFKYEVEKMLLTGEISMWLAAYILAHPDRLNEYFPVLTRRVG